MHLRGEEGDVWEPGEDSVDSFGCAEEGDEDDITLMDTMIFQDLQSCEDRCSRLWGDVRVCALEDHPSHRNVFQPLSLISRLLLMISYTEKSSLVPRPHPARISLPV